MGILRPVDDAEALQATVMAWGRERSDVRAVLVVGSRARADTPADQWSDTDLVLMVDDPAPYLASFEWLGAFGRPLLSFVEPTAIGPFAERRVLFETGLEVDLVLLPVDGARWMVEDPEGIAVCGAGSGCWSTSSAWRPACGAAPPSRPQPACPTRQGSRR
jgi:aminoglycoside 6-adenylyltransferase